MTLPIPDPARPGDIVLYRGEEATFLGIAGSKARIRHNGTERLVDHSDLARVGPGGPGVGPDPLDQLIAAMGKLATALRRDAVVSAERALRRRDELRRLERARRILEGAPPRAGGNQGNPLRCSKCGGGWRSKKHRACEEREEAS